MSGEPLAWCPGCEDVGRQVEGCKECAFVLTSIRLERTRNDLRTLGDVLYVLMYACNLSGPLYRLVRGTLERAGIED